VARAATTLDPFNAIAEPKRRQVLEALSDQEWAVNDVVGRLGWPQPMVSKHLGVLKEVGLVSVRKEGRQRLYRVNGETLKAVHDWLKTFEKLWTHQLDRVKERAERKARERSSSQEQ
jgi:DNA-binding transcriptional ArsR family regulator